MRPLAGLLAVLVGLAAVPLRAAVPEAAKPNAETVSPVADAAPLADALYACTIRYPAGDPQCGKDACDRPFSGTFADVAEATKRCGTYAATHGGKCNNDCKAEQGKAEAWSAPGRSPTASGTTPTKGGAAKRSAARAK